MSVRSARVARIHRAISEAWKALLDYNQRIWHNDVGMVVNGDLRCSQTVDTTSVGKPIWLVMTAVPVSSNVVVENVCGLPEIVRAVVEEWLQRRLNN